VWNGVPPPISGIPFHHLNLPFQHLNLPFNHLAKPFHLDGPHCIFWSDDFPEIITTVATRCQNLRLNCTKFYFSWGSRPPNPLAGFKGLLLRGGRGGGFKECGKGRREGRWRKRREGRGGRDGEERGDVHMAFHDLYFWVIYPRTQFLFLP